MKIKSVIITVLVATAILVTIAWAQYTPPSGGGGSVGTVTSVGFTGGLISVATPTSTPAFTVAGTSGGIPYFSAAATWASSGALTHYGIVLGGGAGATPTSTSADTTTTHALFATATAPAFRAIAAGDIPYSAVPPPTLPTPGSTCSLSAPGGYCICTTTCTVTAFAPAAAGDQFCVFNDVGVSTGVTISGITSTYFSKTDRSAYGAAAGSFVGTAAAGLSVCFVGRDTTHWVVTNSSGTWTAN